MKSASSRTKNAASKKALKAGRDTVTFADVESAGTGVLSETALAKNETLLNASSPHEGTEQGSHELQTF